jgi:hypothetical protein
MNSGNHPVTSYASDKKLSQPIDKNAPINSEDKQDNLKINTFENNLCATLKITTFEGLTQKEKGWKFSWKKEIPCGTVISLIGSSKAGKKHFSSIFGIPWKKWQDNKLSFYDVHYKEQNLVVIDVPCWGQPLRGTSIIEKIDSQVEENTNESEFLKKEVLEYFVHSLVSRLSHLIIIVLDMCTLDDFRILSRVCNIIRQTKTPFSVVYCTPEMEQVIQLGILINME